MARFPFISTFKDEQGNIVPSGTIQVNLAGTTTAATVYSTESGPVISGGTITSDAQGDFEFWVDSSDYGPGQRFSLVFSKTGFATKTRDDTPVPRDGVLSTIYDASEDHTYTIVGGELAANRNINLPVLTGDDTFVFTTATQTLKNKSIGDPTDPTKTIAFNLSGATTGKAVTVTANHTNNRTLTIPDASGSIILTSGTQTLSQKTLITPTIADLSNMTHTHVDDASGGAITFTGRILQTANTQENYTTHTGTTTTALPADTSVPSNTEGAEFITVSITPASTSNKLRIQANISVSSGNATKIATAAMFQDSGSTPIAISSTECAASGAPTTIYLDHWMTATTTSSVTYKIRAGLNTTHTLTYNPFWGSVTSSSITVSEYQG